jgi:hypothetical protein
VSVYSVRLQCPSTILHRRHVIKSNQLIYSSYVQYLQTLRLLLLLVVLRVVGGLVLVDLLEELERSLLESISLGLEVSGVDILTTLDSSNGLSELSNLGLDLLGLGLVNLGLELVHGRLGVVADLVGSVSSLNGLSSSLILLLVLLGIVDHLLNLGIRETGRSGNGDGGVLVGGLVSGRDVDDSIGINVERNLNLGDTLGGGGDTGKSEVTDQLVVSNKLSLTLENSDLDGSLTLSGGREDLGLLGGDRRVSVDESSEDTTESLDTKRQRSNIKQEDISDLTGKNSTLDRSTNGNSLIGVDGLVGLLAKDGLDSLNDLGHSGHTSNEDNLINLGRGDTGILEGLLDGLDGSLNKRTDKSLELGSGQLGVDVLRAGGVSSDERKVDLGVGGGRQLGLGLLNGLSDSLDGHSVTREVNAVVLLELVNKVSDKNDIEILTTKVSVTVGRLDLEDTLLDLENGDIESTSTKIEDGNNLVVVLLKTVSESGGGRLVDNSQNVQANNLTSVLGGLSLGIVEVGGDGDHGVLDGLSEVALGGLLHLVEDETSNLGGGVSLALGLKPSVTVRVLDNLEGHLLDVVLDLGVLESSTNQTLGGEQGVLGVDNGLSLGGDTDKSLAVLGEGNDGGGGSVTLSVLNHLGGLTLHDGDGGVGGTEIDTDDGTLDLSRVESLLEGGESGLG